MGNNPIASPVGASYPAGMDAINPYQSPTYISPRSHTMPTWLKRFIAACAVLGAVILLCDLIQLHRLSVDPTNQYSGLKPQEIVRAWIEAEVYGPAEE